MDLNINPNLNVGVLNPVTDAILRTLQTMQEQINHLQSKQYLEDHGESSQPPPPSQTNSHHSYQHSCLEMPLDFHPGHPFTEFIMTEPVPQTYWPLAHLKLYDGTTDPQSHIDAFKNAMLVSRDSNAMCCKAFLSTLSEAVQQWFSSSSRRFADLTDKFQSFYC